MIRGVSVPLGITTPGEPNRVFYFDSATSPTVFWVPLADLDFKEGASVRKLELVGDKTFSGNAAAHFKEARPFEFLVATAK